MSEEEIKDVLKRSGISPKIMDRLNEYVETNVPHYAPKLAKLEADMEEIKQILQARQQRTRTPNARKKKR